MVEILNKEKGFEAIDKLSKNYIPFFFLISYDKTQIIVQELDKLDPFISVCLGCENSTENKVATLQKDIISFNEYKKAFDSVIDEIKSGNTYLLNLTFKSRIYSSLNLSKLYNIAHAPYKLLIDDSFLCFSPESFITIKDNKISTFPMKGTIDASIYNAKEKILNNKKEMAEHVMVVDLLRNDLNIVAKGTSVESFRYVTKIRAGKKELLQVSSKISANLSSNWQKNLANILDKLTPAGSITGTPKRSTINIIEKIEPNQRGFYTGVFGVFDGKELNSAVAIRAISKEGKSLFYHSGGGITLDSNVEDEYQEMIDKIYIPV